MMCFLSTDEKKPAEAGNEESAKRRSLDHESLGEVGPYLRGLEPHHASDTI